MEPSQVAHINKNFKKLIESTICSTTFKACLKSKDFISNEEDQRMVKKTALGKNEGPIREANELYNILITRVDGYQGLKDALLETKQTGALKVLEELGLPDEVRTEQWENVLELGVVIAGECKTMKDIFPELTLEDAVDVLKCADVHEEFMTIKAAETQSLSFDTFLPCARPQYITRFVCNKRLIDQKLFQMPGREVFVFKGMTMNDVIHCEKPQACVGSTGQRYRITSRHILLDDDDDLEDLIFVCEHPLHVVSKQGNSYILEHSTKLTESVMESCSDLVQNGNKSFCTSEDQYIETILRSTDNKLELLCAPPGMGKSWLMESIARKLLFHSKDKLLVFVRLSAWSKLVTDSLGETSDESLLQGLLNHAYGSKLATSLIQINLKRSRPKLIFVLDGFDELRDGTRSRACVFFNTLLELENIKLIISSRSELQNHLEKTFKRVSYNILPFDKEGQTDALVQHWSHALPTGNTGTFKEFATRCLEVANGIWNPKINEVLGIPLKCFILSTICGKQAQQLSAPNRRRPLHIPDDVIASSIKGMFAKLVDYNIEGLDVFEKIISSLKTTSYKLKSTEIYKYIACLSKNESYNARELTQFAIKHGLSLYYTPACFKQRQIGITLERDRAGDLKLMEILHLYFCGQGALCSGVAKFIQNTNSPGYSGFSEEFNALELLRCVDKQDASETFSGLNMDSWYMFEKIQNIKTIQLFISIFPDLKKCNQLIWNYQHMAVHRGRVDWLEYLIKSGYDVNEETKCGRLPVHEITPRNAMKTLEVLIKHKADIFATDTHKQNLVHRILWHTKLFKLELPCDLIQFTFDNGFVKLWLTADIEGITPFEQLSDIVDEDHHFLASLKKNLSMEELQVMENLEKGIHLRRAVHEANDDKLIDLLLRDYSLKDPETAFPSSQENIGRILTSGVFEHLNIEKAREALYKLEIIDPDQAFFYLERVDTLKLLVQICEDFTVCNKHEWTYLHCAVWQGKVDWVEYLIESGCKVNQKDNNGCTPLHRISIWKPIQMMNLLKKHDVDVYALNDKESNVAHCLLEAYKLNKMTVPKDWVTYTLDNGHHKLWSMVNIHGETPMEVLSRLQGPDHPTTKEVQRFLETLPLTDH